MSKFREYLGIPDLPPVMPHWKFPSRMVQAYDGTTQKSTWATIDAGTPAIETTNDLCVAREV